MRLLNTTTLELHEFFDDKIPRYAILSHRWEDGEVTFKDVSKKRNLKAPGWIKIQKSCELALKRQHRWIWIDTCCIDKRSSAELSEAVNSMYRWYSKAAECYAYLNDVSCNVEDVTKINSWPPVETTLRGEVQRDFRSSEWFSRGWTLQELLAPSNVLFIDRDWKGTIGSKNSLAPLLSEITGISKSVLESTWLVKKCSIAQRMSWASKRVCSRKEDVAYCLLGIFEVNMPLLYGEGGRTAFRRLQLEILKESNDESIFAWNHELNDTFRDRTWDDKRGSSYDTLLASHPSVFSGSSAILSLDTYAWAPRAPYAMTNRGMAFQTILGPPSGGLRAVAVPLRCFDIIDAESADQITPLVIYLLYKNAQDYMRATSDYTLDGDYDRVSMCPEEFLDREKRCFVGEEILIYIEA